MRVSSRDKMPETWYSNIEKCRTKANKLLKKVVGVDLNTSIVIGKLEDVSLDKLFRLNYPFCKLTLGKTKKYRIDEKLESRSESGQVCFVNKPHMIMDLTELSTKFPQIHEDVHVDIKRGRFE